MHAVVKVSIKMIESRALEERDFEKMDVTEKCKENNPSGEEVCGTVVEIEDNKCIGCSRPRRNDQGRRRGRLMRDLG